MFIELISSQALNYKFGNKIDEDGYLTEEPDENVKVVFPPKRRGAYNSDEEFNNAEQEYKKFKEDCLRYQEAVKKIFDATFHPDKDRLVSKNEIKRTIKEDNKTRLENDAADEVAREDVDLSSSEVIRRKKIQNEVQDIVAEKLSIQYLGGAMISEYCRMKGLGQPPRPVMNLFSSGCSTLDDLLYDYNVLVNGSQEAKNLMFKRKYQSIKETAYNCCEQKTEEEYVEFFRKDFQNINVLSEMEASNMKGVMKYWGVEIEEKTLAEIKTNYNRYVSAGSLSGTVGKMANPYYTIIKESCYKANISLDDGKNGVIEFGELTERQHGTANDLEDIKNGVPLTNILSNYLSDISFGKKEKLHPEDMLYLYFDKSGGNINTIKDEDGNIIKGTPDILSRSGAKELLDKNRSFLVYDTLGNFKTKISIPDYDMCDIPQTYNKLRTVNFKFDNTVGEIQKLKKEFSKTESFFSSDHQEFKNVKKFIDGMEKSYKDGTSLSELCSKLRKLAVTYVESKYQKDTPEKTGRTYMREEFMCRLIGSIDNKYPIEYPVNLDVSKRTLVNLEKADLKNDKFLNDAIRLNEKGLGKEEIENYLDNELYKKDKNQIEVNIEEDKKELQENNFIPDKEEKEEVKVVGMSEKDI